MMTLGAYETLAKAYNGTSTITYKIPAEIGLGEVQVINEGGLEMFMTNTTDGVTEIRFESDADDRRYPGTFEGFEFGMHWTHPTYIGAFIEAKGTHGKHFEGDNGTAHYDAIVDENNHLTVLLTPSK
jgi:hypothetical protein